MGQSIQSCCDVCSQSGGKKELVVEELVVDRRSEGSGIDTEQPVAAVGGQEKQAELSWASSPSPGRSHGRGAEHSRDRLADDSSAQSRSKVVSECSWHSPAGVLAGDEDLEVLRDPTSGRSTSFWSAHTRGGRRCCSYRSLGTAWGTVVLTGTVGSYAGPALLRARGFGAPCLAAADDPAARSSMGMTLALHVAGCSMFVSGVAAVWILMSANSDHLWYAAKVALLAWAFGMVNFEWFVAMCNEGRYDCALVHMLGIAFYFVGLLFHVGCLNMVTDRLRPIMNAMNSVRCPVAISTRLQWSAQWLAPLALIGVWLVPTVVTFSVGIDLFIPTMVAVGTLVAAFTVWACVPLIMSIRRARWLAEHSCGQLAKEGRWAFRALTEQLLGLVLLQGSSIAHVSSLAMERAGFRFGVAVTSLDVVLNAIGALAFSGAFTGAVQGEARMRQKAIAASRKRQNSLEPPALAREPDRQWDATVEILAGRGFTLRALLRFFAGLGTNFMLHYDPTKHTTADVVRRAIIPLSRSRRSAVVGVIMHGRTVRPTTMVTHTWSGLFVHLVAGICAHALDIVEYSHLIPILVQRDLGDLEQTLLGANALDATYWVCALSINQHAVICGRNPLGDRDPVTRRVHPICDCSCNKTTSTTKPVNDSGKSIFCEVNKFSDMMRLLARENSRFEQLILVDEKFRLFTRAWCMAEIATAHDIGMVQCVAVLSADAFDRHRRDLQSLQIEHMAATRPQDKEDILREVGDTDAFNRHVNELLFKDLFPNWLEFDSMSQVMRITSMLRVQRFLQSSGVYTECAAAGKADMAPA